MLTELRSQLINARAAGDYLQAILLVEVCVHVLLHGLPGKFSFEVFLIVQLLGAIYLFDHVFQLIDCQCPHC